MRMPAIVENNAPDRLGHLHVILSPEEIYAVRMVAADSGTAQIGKYCREILMDVIRPRFDDLRRRGVGRPTPPK
jgi:hypothetical protein